MAPTKKTRATRKPKSRAKKPEPVEPYYGTGGHHQRTGAQYRVISLSRTEANNKGSSKSLATQFYTKKDAAAWARSQSRDRENRAYAVVDTKDYKYAVREVYTHGKINKSLTSGLKDAYKKKDGSGDYGVKLELFK